MPLIPLVVKGGLVIGGMLAAGSFLGKTGEAVDDTATAFVKFAVAGGIAFYVYKKVL